MTSGALLSSVLVIGSNSGIGAACVQTFLANGWNVHGTFHEASERAAALASERYALTQLDVTDIERVTALPSELDVGILPLDAVVYNASFSEPGLWNQPPLDISPKALAHAFSVEVCGLHRVLQAVHPILAPGCSIVTFSSASVAHGDSDTFTYNLAKSAVATYTHMFARYYGQTFRINCVAPDSIATDWLTSWPVSDQESAEFRVLQSGARRMGRPDEAANCVYFLCTSDSSYLSGKVITLDGGAG